MSIERRLHYSRDSKITRDIFRVQTFNCSTFQDAKHGAEIKAVDAYCWLHSTVHLDTSLLRKLNTMPQVRAPCIGLNTANTGLDPQNTPMETLYYQWVPFFLLFQVSFYNYLPL